MDRNLLHKSSFQAAFSRTRLGKWILLRAPQHKTMFQLSGAPKKDPEETRPDKKNTRNMSRLRIFKAQARLRLGQRQSPRWLTTDNFPSSASFPRHRSQQHSCGKHGRGPQVTWFEEPLKVGIENSHAGFYMRLPGGPIPPLPIFAHRQMETLTWTRK